MNKDSAYLTTFEGIAYVKVMKSNFHRKELECYDFESIYRSWVIL